MNKKNILNCFVAFMLCFAIIFNCNSFRRDTYAVVPAVGAVVVIGGAAVTVTAAAVLYLVGSLKAGGVVVDNVNDANTFVSDFFTYNYNHLNMSEEQFNRFLTDNGFYYNEDTHVIDVRDDTVLVKYHYNIARGTYNVYEYPVWNGDADIVDSVNSAGDAVKTGVKVSYDTLTNLGSSIYDYLHNSSTVTYDPGFSAAVVDFDEANALFLDLIKSYIMYDYTDDLTANSYKLNYRLNNVTTNDADVLSYDIYVSAPYYIYGGKGVESLPDDITKNYSINYYVNVVGNLADGRCYLPNTYYSVRNIFYVDGHSPYTDLGVHSYTNVAIYDNLDALVTAKSLNDYDCYGFFGANRFTFADSTWGDGLIAHYALSQDASIAQPHIKVGDSTCVLDPPAGTGDTLWDSPASIVDAVAGSGAFSDSDDTCIAFPGVGVSGATDFDWDKEYPGVFNPDLPDVAVDPPSSIVGSDNILDWIKDFFYNFFSRLYQTLINAITDVFKSAFVPPDGYFEYKINEIREKHCSSAGTIHFDELEIPDITWNPSGSRWSSVIQQPVTIINNSFLRNNIDTFRGLICGFIYFIWLLNRMYKLLRLLGVVYVPNEKPDSVVVVYKH